MTTRTIVAFRTFNGEEVKQLELGKHFDKVCLVFESKAHEGILQIDENYFVTDEDNIEVQQAGDYTVILV